MQHAAWEGEGKLCCMFKASVHLASLTLSPALSRVAGEDYARKKESPGFGPGLSFRSSKNQRP